MMTNYDYWANHTFLRGPQPTEKAVIDYLLSEAKSPYSHDISDLSARITLSALALLGDKEYARSGTHRKPGGLGNLYQSQRLQSYLNAQLQNYRSLLETAPDISILPTGSFSISFQFTLSSPYISRDDTVFHLLDNPVKKEWVFKLPYVAAPQWKGALCAAIRQMKKPDKVESELLRLFGTANDADNSGKRGCLYFYPSFFDQISLEVINPHDRETGAGSQPIYFEAVPAGATATFTLLYVPLYPVDKDVSEPRRQVATDIQLVADGIKEMLTLYGFGAKTSSGFGLANSVVQDGVVVGGVSYKSELFVSDVTSPYISEPELARYLVAPDKLHSDFISNAGDLKNETEYQRLIEKRGKKYTKKDKQLYKKAKNWWEREGKKLYQKTGLETELSPLIEIPTLLLSSTESFDNLNDLPAVVHKLTDVLYKMENDK